MIIKKLYLFTFLALIIVYLSRWFSCTNFKPEYHLSLNYLKLESDNLIHNDINVPFILIRAYHNKITLFLTSLYTSYLLFWDIKFLSHLLLFSGLLGIMSGFAYGYENIFRNLWVKVLVLTMLVFPLMEFIVNPAIYFPLKISLYSLPYVLFSIFGNIKLIERYKGYKIYFILIVVLFISVWWNIYSPFNYKIFC